MKSPVVAASILDDVRGVARHTAAWLVETIAQAGERRIAICLSGGTTPRALYALLAQPEYAKVLPWPRIHWFWGDERFVPPSDDRNNASMARHLLLNGAPIPCENVHPIPTMSANASAAADEYERELKEFYGATEFASDRPLFDVTLLGVGDDGHTASLFPGSPLLEEHSRWVAAVSEHKPDRGNGKSARTKIVSVCIVESINSGHGIFIIMKWFTHAHKDNVCDR